MDGGHNRLVKYNHHSSKHFSRVLLDGVGAAR